MNELEEICKMYEKHGWNLSRVLFSEDSVRDYFESTKVEVVESDLNALWFTRPNGEAVTWEIRHLSKTPYALCTRVEPDDSDEDREFALSSLEDKLRKR